MVVNIISDDMPGVSHTNSSRVLLFSILSAYSLQHLLNDMHTMNGLPLRPCCRQAAKYAFSVFNSKCPILPPYTSYRYIVLPSNLFLEIMYDSRATEKTDFTNFGINLIGCIFILMLNNYLQYILTCEYLFSIIAMALARPRLFVMLT